MKLKRSSPAVLGVPGHKQALQLLVCVGGILVDLHEAVVDVAADLRGQGWQQMVIFYGWLGYVANPEFALPSCETRWLGRGARSRESWMSRGPRAGLPLLFSPPFCIFTKECGLEVDCHRVQERACAKAGSTLCRPTCFVYIRGCY